MKSQKDIERFVAYIDAETRVARDQHVLDSLVQAHEDARQKRQPLTWRIIMRGTTARLATAATLLLVLGLSVIVLDRMTTPAWAWEDAIAALKSYRGVYATLAFPGGTADLWMRSNTAGTHSTDVVLRTSEGTIMWTRDGSTYSYEPNENTVYYVRALTAGTVDWLRPELLETFSADKNSVVMRGKDAATGRDRVTLLCSSTDADGAGSWVIDFDAATKLPVSIKQWQNLDRSGPSSVDVSKITYYEDLPDSVFDVQIPGEPNYVQKPLTIPEESIGRLSDPGDGMVADGMTQQEAAEGILRATYRALIEGDLATLKQMAPMCKHREDDFLRAFIITAGRDDRIVEVLEIGPISEAGHSKLGPIVALPVTVRQQDSVKIRGKMIVQFRQIGGVSSCVVHGPYGLPQEIE